MPQLAGLWREAVVRLGGVKAAALATGQELEAQYSEPHRRYHTATHIVATHEAAALLADAEDLGTKDRARLDLAVCAHDVIYWGRADEDEAASATWADVRLARCGVRVADREWVVGAILATSVHTGHVSDRVVDCLLDADLSILGADPDVYARYAVAVRDEYSHVEDSAWSVGRRAVLEALLTRSPLYRTAEGQRVWEAAARRNVESELAAYDPRVGRPNN